MPGFFVQEGAMVMCIHGGQANGMVPNPAVSVMGMPTFLLSEPWLIAGCPGVPPASVPPCVTAQWMTGTIRVTSYGQPLLVQSSTGMSMPAGTPLLIVLTQLRVGAT